MRKTTEKKTVSKSFRITKTLEGKIKKKAKAKNMSFGAYVGERLSHDENLLTPEILSIIQEIVNQVNNCEVDDITKENIDKECEKLWASLK